MLVHRSHNPRMGVDDYESPPSGNHGSAGPESESDHRTRRPSALAKELHDGPIQTLTAAALQLDAFLQSDAGADRPETILAARRLTIEAIDDLRTLTETMAPLRTPDGDLLDSLAAAGRELTEGSLSLAIEGRRGVALRADEAETLYLVGREALANAAFHARGTGVVLRLDADDDAAVLEIVDDGVGFDPRLVGDGHQGLKLMQERMAEVGGTLDLTVDDGVHITASIPRERRRTPEADSS